jgi:hypothetical protein
MFMSTTVRTSRKAQASLMLGLLTLVCSFLAFSGDAGLLVFPALVLFLPALILGFRAKSQVRASDGALRGSGLAALGIGATLGSLGLGILQMGV